MAVVQRREPEESESLSQALHPIVRRMRYANWLRLASRGLLAGTLAACIAAGLNCFFLLPNWLHLEVAVPVAILLGLAAGTVAALVWKIPVMDAARFTETRLGLKERLSSALEFEHTSANSRKGDATLLLRLQHRDAATHAQALKPQQAVALSIPWEAKALIPAILLLAGLLILPNLPQVIPPGLQTERAIVRNSGEKLVQAAKQIASDAAPKQAEETRKAAVKMEGLGHRMANGRLSKQQAMVEISKLSQQMADQQRKMAQQNGADTRKSLADAGNQFAQSMKNQNGAPQNPSQVNEKAQGTPSSQDNADLQRTGEAMQRGDSDGLAQGLQKLAAPPTSPSPLGSDQQRAATLGKLAQSLQGTPYQEAGKHMQAAADALKHGDHAAAAAELKKAADSAQQTARRDNDRQALHDAQQALEHNRDAMAQAASPEDISPGAIPVKSPLGVGKPGLSSAPPEQKQAATSQNAPHDGQNQPTNVRGEPKQGQSSSGQAQSAANNPPDQSGQGRNPSANGQGAANKAQDQSSQGENASGNRPNGTNKPQDASGKGQNASAPGQSDSQKARGGAGQNQSKSGGAQNQANKGQNGAGEDSKASQNGQGASKNGQNGAGKNSNASANGQPGASHGTGKQSAKSSSSGQSQQGGSPSNVDSGQDSESKTRPGPGQYSYSNGTQHVTPYANRPMRQGSGVGGAHLLNPAFDPSKNPKYGRIYLGKPGTGNRAGGKKLPNSAFLPPDKSSTGKGSTVPYYQYAGAAKQSAESAMDKEEIPPAYKSNVKGYFESLQQPHK